jgi:hypothetical protein
MTPLLVLLLAGPAGAQLRFEEIGARSGLVFRLQNGAAGAFHQIELMPGGAAAIDYDNDGCFDLFFTNGASVPSLQKTSAAFHNRLFRNGCNGTFSDVTNQAGVAGQGYSMATAAADFDNDGLADLFVAGVNRNILYRNRGNGTFEDVTQRAGLGGADARYGKMWSISAGWFDADKDGWLDLFVSSYVDWNPTREPSCGTPQHRLYCHPDAYAGRPHQLFRNNGDGTFRDVSAESGIAANLGKGMGVAFADFDRDGLPDVFVANDSVRNFLFHNRGNFKFEEIGLMAGVALNEAGRAVASMGVDFRDADNDGLPDLIVTAMLNDTYPFFRNTGKTPFFDDFTAGSGLARPTRHLTGWGAGMYDFDNDGNKDIFVANAHFPALEPYLAGPTALPNSVFRNLGGGRFEDVSSSAGDRFRIPAHHRAAVFADFDNDGRIDIAVTSLDSHVKLYRNVTTGGNWVALKLVGQSSNRDGLGAEVKVMLTDGRILHNHATTSVGYASSSEPLVRFGTGRAEIRDIEIRWPSGVMQRLSPGTQNRVVVVREPAAARPEKKARKSTQQ